MTKFLGGRFRERSAQKCVGFFVCFLLAVCLPCGAGHAELNADDFLPPVQVEGTQKEELMTVKDEGAVKTAVDPVLQKEVTTASNLQDAINKTIKKPRQGCSILAEPGGGYAFVATGQASYKTESVTVTAGRIAQRNAYIEAFMNAKAQMAQTVGEIVVRGATDFSKKIDKLDSDTKELRNIETDLSEEQLQTVRKVLKGYVTYAVKNERTNVYVTIVSSSKTRGKFSRSGADGLVASNLREGLNTLISEIRSGFVPPVGGRIIEVPATGEVAYVGFGSSVVYYDREEDVQEELKLEAEQVAGLRAVDALAGIILGDDVMWQAHADASTRDRKADFERLQLSDQTTKGSQAEIREYEQRKREMQIRSQTDTKIQSLRQGILPPGVMRDTSLDEDEAFAYGIAVYVPSLSDAARSAAREMDEAELVRPPASSQNSPSSSGTAGGASEPPQPEPTYKIKQGPSGVVQQNL
ncbi:MAG: hypothetical protein LBP21_09240 [Synergistaceae bacterium]|nr:hypothetical protein [Synergistaceae bacterium]